MSKRPLQKSQPTRMVNMLTLLEKLAATSSKNEKQKILKENDSPLLRRVVRATYDASVRYHIRNVPKILSSGPTEPDMSLEDGLDFIENTLATRQLTGNKAYDMLAQVLHRMTKDDRNVLQRVLERDLRCGISVKSINAVFGDIVPDFEKHVMLAQPLNDKSAKRLTFPAYVQTKMDGVRVNVFVNLATNDVMYYTRKGQQMDIDPTGQLSQQMLYAANQIQFLSRADDIVVFDGEIVGYEYGESMSRRKSNGIVNKTLKQTATPFEVDCLRVFLWDIIPYSGWRNRKSDVPYYKRIETLFQSVNAGLMQHTERQSLTQRVMVVATELVPSIKAAQRLADAAIAQGEEGVVVKPTEGIWEGKRSFEMIKFKGVYDGTFRVTDVMPHSKDPSLMGALFCESDDGMIQFSVGTGFSQHERETITEDAIGSYVDCTFNDVIGNKTDEELSLFLPVFVDFRADKDEADSIKQVYEAMGKTYDTN